MNSTTAAHDAAGRIYQPLNSSLRQTRVLELLPGTINDLVSASLRVISLPSGQRSRWSTFAEQLLRLAKEATNYPVQATSEETRPLTEYATASQSSQLVTEAHGVSQNFPAYEAISYSWGEDINAKDLMSLNGIVFNAPATAVDVLRAFRSSSKEQLFWLDALSINQTDIKERASQVTIMGQIYTNATRTRVWLGHSNEQTTSAMSLCQEIAERVARELTGGREQLTDITWHDLYGACMRVPIPSTLQLSLVRDVFARRWWARLWVQQEVVLSRECVCYVGTSYLPWISFTLFAHWVIQTIPRGAEGSDEMTQDVVKHLYSSAVSFNYQADSTHCQFGMSLHLLMIVTRALRSSNPRDRISGVLSLTRWSKTDLPLPSGIQPDYEKSIRDCMRDATLVMIEEAGDLEPISDRRLHAKRPQSDGQPWPSWTPVWCASEEEDFAEFSGLKLRACADRRLDLKTITASHDPNCLALKGFAIDTVCGQPFRRILREDVEDLKPIYRLTQELCSYYKSVETSHIHLKEMDGPQTMALLGGEYFKTAEDLRQQASESIETGAAQPDQEKMRRTINSMSACTGRQFFSSSTGLRGLSSGIPKPGDLLVVLFGGNRPFLLRRNGSDYELVAYCYVVGIMHGEFVRHVEAEGIEPTTFYIR